MFLNRPWNKYKQKLSWIASSFFLFFIAFYKTFLSSLLGTGGCCRFYPSCSDYAFLAYKNLPFWKASVLVWRRLLDCRPLGPKFREEPYFENSGGSV